MELEPSSSLEEVFAEEEEEFPAPREGEELQEVEEEEEEGDGGQMFSAWMSRYRGGQGGAVGGALSVEDEENTEQHGRNTDTVSTSFRPAPRRRSSLPCPSTLSAMQLSRLHSLAQAPVSASVLQRRSSSRSLLTSQEADLDSPMSAVAAVANKERRCSLVPPPIPEASEEGAPKKTQFRRRNVMSLSDADSTCLICHDDLYKAGKKIRELECAHSFHNECIDVWLWRKRACPTCRVPAVSNSVDWLATQVKVP